MHTDTDIRQLRQWLQEQALALGFQQLGISHVQLDKAERHLREWLAAGYHGDMDWMARHGSKRTRPAELVPGTCSIISVRMDYLPEPMHRIEAQLQKADRAFISRYALGRDYHKLMRRRLQRLADAITQRIGPFGYRVFVDSAPVMERHIAELAGLGWIGKNALLINEQAGSWFFLGEIYTDLPLPADGPAAAHCGTCRACIDICPTGAIVADGVVDARRCISYLTIECRGAIPVELRAAMGNRIYGCDDCQLACPWNRFAGITNETGFLPRHGLDDSALVTLFNWDEATFLQRTEGSPIRRIGHERWLRNLAVALGNAPWSATIEQALRARADHPSALVREHVHWALAQISTTRS